MIRENWTTFFITSVNKYYLPLQSNFLVKLKAISHCISQNLEVIDHPVPEIKSYNGNTLEPLLSYGGAAGWFIVIKEGVSWSGQLAHSGSF